jgi:Flp pilus assembly protein TadG
VRVQLKPEDSGAVAIIVALSTVGLAIVAAFSTDLGLAYNSSRQLQTSADAASLAAAGQLASHPGTCATIVADTAAVSAARTLADQVSQSNRPGRTPTTWSVACSPDNKRVEVTYGNSGTTTGFFGGLTGATSIGAAKSATAEVFVPSGVGGLRPYFLCLSDAQALEATSGSGFLDIPYPNAACGNEGGNWYSVDCPEDGTGNSTPVIGVNTSEGCDSEISIVDTSGAYPPVTAAFDPTIEKSLLLQACDGGLSGSAGCLTGNTGNLASNPVQTAWDGLLGKSIALPVFRADTVVGSGNNAKYPIKAILGAKVCAYEWQNKQASSSDPDCAGVVFPSGPPSDHLWLKFETIQVSGSSKPNPVCAVGDPLCKFNAVRLVD